MLTIQADIMAVIIMFPFQSYLLIMRFTVKLLAAIVAIQICHISVCNGLMIVIVSEISVLRIVQGGYFFCIFVLALIHISAAFADAVRVIFMILLDSSRFFKINHVEFNAAF